MGSTLNIPLTTWKKCCPHYVEDFDRCAGISVCSLKPVMPDEWDDIYLSGGLPRVDSALAEADFQGKSCLPTVNSLYDWISAIRRNWSAGSMKSGRTRNGTLEFEPFVKMARTGPINNQWWRAVYGGAAGGGEPVGSHKYVVTSLSGTIPNSELWFQVGMQVFFSSKDNTGAFVMGSGTVAAVDTVSTDLTIWVTPVPGSSYGQALPGVSGASDVDEGILTRGIINVSQYEEYCSQIPALNTRQDAYFWVGETRLTFCDSELQKQFIDLALQGNPLYRNYMHVDDVEYNRQMKADFDRRMVENFFFGRPLSDKQTYNTWDELPQITLDFEGLDIPGHGACVGRKANPVGILPQLGECGRLFDKGGAVLKLTDIFDQIYIMQRLRRDNGVESNVFEAYTSNHFARLFDIAMISYYKARSQDTMRMNLEMRTGKQGPLGFYYRDYELDYPAGVTLRIMTHPYFDDWADAHHRMNALGTDIRARGNNLWFIDWSTIYQAILASTSVTNTTGDLTALAAINQDMACRMKTKKTTYRHTSILHTNVVECADTSAAFMNFASTPPDHTGDPTVIGIGSVPWDTSRDCATS